MSRRWPAAASDVSVAAAWLPGDALPAGALDCVLATNEHGIYCVPRSSAHRDAARTVLRHRVWESATLDLTRAADRAGDIVHAGSYFGDYIPALARSREDGAIVWAFEPGRENYRCAQITVLLNDLENVVLTPAALDVNSGSALLATSNFRGLPHGGGSFLITDPAGWRGVTSEEVALVRVDEVVGSDRRVAVIQLDVEGHEQQALSGAMRTIERCRPLLVLEQLPEPTWFAENLAPLGYEVERIVERNFAVRPRE